jgi:hypothetical protein
MADDVVRDAKVRHPLGNARLRSTRPRGQEDAVSGFIGRRRRRRRRRFKFHRGVVVNNR